MSRIVYLAQMSAACRAGLPELCSDASCENYAHDTDDLEPLELTPEQEHAQAVEFDARARRREDR
jgi:hypothetical protein